MSLDELIKTNPQKILADYIYNYVKNDKKENALGKIKDYFKDETPLIRGYKRLKNDYMNFLKENNIIKDSRKYFTAQLRDISLNDSGIIMELNKSGISRVIIYPSRFIKWYENNL